MRGSRDRLKHTNVSPSFRAHTALYARRRVAARAARRSEPCLSPRIHWLIRHLAPRHSLTVSVVCALPFMRVTQSSSSPRQFIETETQSVAVCSHAFLTQGE
jgi:hypothetical protein